MFHDLVHGEYEMYQTRPYSWTYSQSVAQGFATQDPAGRGFVVKAIFEPHEILLDLTRIKTINKEESEVIVEESTTKKLCQVLYIYEGGKSVPCFAPRSSDNCISKPPAHAATAATALSAEVETMLVTNFKKRSHSPSSGAETSNDSKRPCIET